MEQTTTQTASFTLLRTYYEAYQKMDDTAKLQYMDAIMSYGFDGQEPTFTSPMADLAFTLIRPTLENSVQYHAIKRECGAKGGRPKKKNTEENNQTETKTKPNDNQSITEINREYESESENDNEYDSESDSFAAGAAMIWPKGDGEGVCLEDFELLWEAYPNKTGRQAALRAYYDTGHSSNVLIPMIREQSELYAGHDDLEPPPLSAWLEKGAYINRLCIFAFRKKEPGQSPGS